MSGQRRFECEPRMEISSQFHEENKAFSIHLRAAVIHSDGTCAIGSPIEQIATEEALGNGRRINGQLLLPCSRWRILQR